jgi:hypothetical protein
MIACSEAESGGNDFRFMWAFMPTIVGLCKKKKGVRRRLLTLGSGEGGIGGVPCEVADDLSDGERVVGQAKGKARGLGGQFLG